MPAVNTGKRKRFIISACRRSIAAGLFMICPALTVPPLPNAPGEELRWHGLHGAGQGLAVAAAALARRGPLLLLAADSDQARQLEAELHFFLSGQKDAPPVLSFPARETLPYDLFSDQAEVTAARLHTLYRLPTLQAGIVVSSVAAAAGRVPPRRYVAAGSLILKQGDTYSLETGVHNLIQGGYRRVSMVAEQGEFAVRGALLDFFPGGSELPIRIELCDDEVEHIRLFDPHSQRTVQQKEHVHLLPVREYPLDEEAIARFRRQWHEQLDGDPADAALYRDISAGSPAPGAEYYLPLFFAGTSTLFDYLPPALLLVRTAGGDDAAAKLQDDIQQRYRERARNPERPLLPPHTLFLSPAELTAAAAALPLLLLEADEYAASPAPSLPALALVPGAKQPLAALRDFMKTAPQQRILLTASSAGRLEMMEELLRRSGLSAERVPGWRDFLGAKSPLSLATAPLERGLLLPQAGLALLGESQLALPGAAAARTRRRSTSAGEMVIRHLAELQPGDAVVHEHHGVGRYRGLEMLSVDGTASEFLLLEYEKEDRLYIPITELAQVRRYTGSDEPPLHQLRGRKWLRQRRQAERLARDAAAEILETHARRAARPGFACRLPAAEYAVFASEFPFEETPDQQQAIDNVLADMGRRRPMDRLVCGDVGFGKTEVAMRAAFNAVHNGLQVALLSPTTLLADQHFQSFRERFAEWPVQVVLLSRAATAAEQRAQLQALADGTADIVISTHRLLQKDVQFKNLRLAIIDEEHRFGVRHKEKLKQLRAELDILTLSATPIPRTLYMALETLRDISVIATPPQERLPIRTFIAPDSDILVRDALLRELRRGGQAYYIHNNTRSIALCAQRLQNMLPEARIGIVHGRMNRRQLQRTMADFCRRHCNLLVCTTIVESGLDVGNANTIIIERADRMGLAQLHQLRGRVGRARRQAYAYFLTPETAAEALMSREGMQRMAAVARSGELGAGFALACHDMEIRGAGQLLGDEQSGEIQQVGFALYTEMLNRAMQSLQGNDAPATAACCEVELHTTALLPADYVPDPGLRLVLYKRLAQADNQDALDKMRAEFADRFGPLPLTAHNLLRTHALRLHGAALGIEKIELGRRSGQICFSEQPAVSPEAVLALLEQQPPLWRMADARRLQFRGELPGGKERLDVAEEALQRLAS